MTGKALLSTLATLRPSRPVRGRFSRALALDPAYTPALLGTGKVALRSAQYKEALALAQLVLAREPRNVEALLVAGLASAGLDAWAQASTFFSQVLTLQSQLKGALLAEIITKLAPPDLKVTVR